MSQQAAILHLPVELQWKVCAYIDRPRDLLSLALSCTTLSEAVVPNHIETRVIRCDIRCLGLWKRLTQLRTIAWRYGCLEVVGEEDMFATPWNGDAIVPTGLLGKEIADITFEAWPEDTIEQNPDVQRAAYECMESLRGCIFNMSSLTRFVWTVTQMRPIPGLFAALKTSCPFLEDVQVRLDDEIVFGDAFETSVGSSDLFQLSGLTSFSFTYRSDLSEEVFQELSDLITDMLAQRCPNLRRVQILLNDHSNEHQSHGIFEDGNWEHLESLSLGGEGSLVQIPAAHIVEGFFRRHPHLKYLYVRDHIQDIRWTVTFLHDVRALDIADMDFTTTVPLDATHNLKFLSIIDLTDSETEGNLEFLALIPSLRCLVAKTHSPMHTLLDELARVAPQLERIHLNQHISEHQWRHRSVDKEQKTLDSFCSSVAQLKHLTHLSHFRIPEEPLDMTAQAAGLGSPYLRAIAQALPKLEFIEVQSDGTQRWVSITRNSKGEYTGWSFVSNLTGVAVEDWSGLFFGACKTLGALYR